MRGTGRIGGWRARAFGVVAALCLFEGAAAAEERPREGAIHQLRIYEIFDGNKRQFHERFRDHAMRIMARYDFKIVATWESRHADRTEFVYLLEWPDKATMDDRWAKFMADQEWIGIKRETRKYGALVGEIQSRTLEPTEYSPHTRLLN
ncbi:NIPSNAP family protein [Luteimonas aquatica]|uniref:NIPSNAP family protein n=1 Tax=Luteimonas aquatica TaxID=450364 RepID=UPI001F56CEDA|nr:NIPSNAP family protein [Luteimonas aquatica]